MRYHFQISTALACVFLLSGLSWGQPTPLVLDNRMAVPGPFEAAGVPILMYHGLDAPHGQNPAGFAAQMQLLHNLGYEAITLDHLADWIETGAPPLPPRPIVITFDDVYLSVYTEAFPVLKQLRDEQSAKLFGYNYAHTLYVGVPPGTTPPTSFDHTDWAECLEMEGEGLMFTESHTVTHSRLTELSAAGQRTELRDSKADILTNMGKETVHIAYPFGSYNATTITIAQEEGYRTGVSTVPGLNTRSTPLFELLRYDVNANMGTNATFMNAISLNSDEPAWSTSTSQPGYWAEDYQFAPAGSGERTLTWTFQVVNDGDYIIEAYWTAYMNRATNTPFTVNHLGGSNTVRVDQTQSDTTWVSLGHYSLSASEAAGVTITNDADGFVIADAIRITRILPETPVHGLRLY